MLRYQLLILFVQGGERGGARTREASQSWGSQVEEEAARRNGGGKK